MKTPSSEEALFEAAISLPENAQRVAFLDRECAGDPCLRRRLDALLAAHDEPESLIDSRLPTFRQPMDDLPQEHTGMMVGRYKLLEKLGTGGFGEVWAAEQKEPVRRRVALKVIKLGMDTQQVVARFQAERQALAMMDHLNIARVLDAGATESGRLYFVMELVKGIPITTYCDQEKLDIKGRLDLFVQVCHAIQHAHQKGIIHRDIKPSNIMVTLHDGVPVPKVIDFGIAKATQQELTNQTIYTQYAQFIGTPAYMSPEQAEMSGLDLDTRADIYSLGVLLYELLTGTTPFDNQTLMQSGLDAMRKIIREKEPALPSTRLRESQAGRGVSPAPPARFVPLALDLDWIVMKCLEKDRQRRYETANGVAADILRHLADEPITARPPSPAYRFQKALKRNKLAFTTGMAVVAALTLGMALSVWQALRANREAARAVAAKIEAQQRLRESEALSAFLTQVFHSPDPSRDGRTITVAETLDSASQRLELDLAAQPALRARLQSALASTYHALGLYREATLLWGKVRDFHQATSGPEHAETLAAMHNLANGYDTTISPDEALKLREHVLMLARKILGPEHPTTLTAMNNLAVSYDGVGRRDEALRIKQEVLPLRQKVLGPDHQETLEAMSNVASSYADVGLRQEAIKLRQEALAGFQRTLGPKHPSSLRAMKNLAYSCADVGNHREALRLQVEQLALSKQVLGPEHPETLASMGSLAGSYQAAGRPEEALQLRENLLALSRKVLGPDHRDTIAAIGMLALSYTETGRVEEALKMHEESLALDRRVSGPEAPSTLTAMANLAAAYSRANRTAEALLLLEELQPLMLKVNGPDHAATIISKGYLVSAYTSLDRFDDALRIAEELLTQCHQVLGPEHPNTLSIQLEMALVHRKAGQLAKALVLGPDWLSLSQKVFGPNHPFTLNAMTELAITLQVADRIDEAIALEERALELKRTHLPGRHGSLFDQMTRESIDNLATCYEKAGRDTDAETLR